MPKVRKKILTRTVYAYVKPVNDELLRRRARGLKVSYSLYLDAVLDSHRTGKPFVVKKPITAREKRVMERAKRALENQRA